MTLSVSLPEPVLVASSLDLQINQQPVLHGVSLALFPGQWLAIVGPNGAGKSSLLAVLAGLRAARSGAVTLAGRAINAWPAPQRAQHLAWLSQHGHAEGDLACIDVVRLGRLAQHGWLNAPRPQDEAAVLAAMQETQCMALAQRRLNTLSGGERQRVLLARAFASTGGATQVLLMDEPSTHLDTPHQRALLRSVRQRAAAGVAVATVLHDINLALMADSVLVLAKGRVVAQGAPHAAALQAALVQVFEGAFSIERLSVAGQTRWVVVPTSDCESSAYGSAQPATHPSTPSSAP